MVSMTSGMASSPRVLSGRVNTCTATKQHSVYTAAAPAKEASCTNRKQGAVATAVIQCGDTCLSAGR